jgi:hypothetical protein
MQSNVNVWDVLGYVTWKYVICTNSTVDQDMYDQDMDDKRKLEYLQKLFPNVTLMSITLFDPYCDDEQNFGFMDLKCDQFVVTLSGKFSFLDLESTYGELIIKWD